MKIKLIIDGQKCEGHITKLNWIRSLLSMIFYCDYEPKWTFFKVTDVTHPDYTTCNFLYLTVKEIDWASMCEDGIQLSIKKFFK